MSARRRPGGRLGRPALAVTDGEQLHSHASLDLEDLANLERQGVSFGRVLERAEQAAS